MSANINFILRKDAELLRRQKIAKILNLIAIAFLAGIAIMSFVISLSIKAINIPSLREKQSEIQRRIVQFQDRRAKLFVLSDKLTGVKEIFDKRQGLLEKKQDLAKVTNNILAKVPDKVSINNLEVDGKKITMVVRSTSLFFIGDLINNLTRMVKNKEIINSLTLESLVFNDSGNYFQISLKAEL